MSEKPEVPYQSRAVFGLEAIRAMNEEVREEHAEQMRAKVAVAESATEAIAYESAIGRGPSSICFAVDALLAEIERLTNCHGHGPMRQLWGGYRCDTCGKQIAVREEERYAPRT